MNIGIIMKSLAIALRWVNWEKEDRIFVFFNEFLSRILTSYITQILGNSGTPNIATVAYTLPFLYRLL